MTSHCSTVQILQNNLSPKLYQANLQSFQTYYGSLSGTRSIFPPFCLGVTTFSPKFWKEGDQKKNEWLGDLKELLPWIFAWGGAGGGAYYVSCQKYIQK